MNGDELDKRISSLQHMEPRHWSLVLDELLASARDAPSDRRTAYLIRINYDLVHALHRMDNASAALSKKLVYLTWALVVLTTMLLIDPVMRIIEKIH
jgi:hypothetical protein